MFRGPSDPEQFRVKWGRFGERFYYDPLPACEIADLMDPEDDPFPSVSTIKKVTSRDFSDVAARRVAEFAIENSALIDGLVDGDRRDVALDMLIGANGRGLNKAGARGTAVHQVMEDLAAGRDDFFLDEDARPYLDACKAFLHDQKPTFLYNEVVAISRSLRYGGTLDCIVSINNKTYLVDWKSRKAGGHAAYDEEAWQVAAYAKADYLIVDDGGQPRRIRVPKLDGGLIVSICPNPDSYKVYPVDIDKGFDGFHRLRLLWEAKHSKMFRALGRPVELNPRTYVPQDFTPPSLNGTFTTTPSKSEVVVTSTLSAGADVGSLSGTEAPAPTFPDVGQYVLVTWMDRFAGGGEDVLAEQRAEGFLVGADHTSIHLSNGLKISTGRKDLKIVATDPPKPVGVVPFKDPSMQIEGAVVQPETATVPAVASAGSSVAGGIEAPPATDGDPEIRAWLRRRIEADVAALGGQSALIKFWPKGIKPIDAAGQNRHTAAELARIETALDNLEREVMLPFGETKPGTAVAPERPDLHLAPVASEDALDIPSEPIKDWSEFKDDYQGGVVNKPAHPDDVALMVERVHKISADFPQTYRDNIVPKVKAAGIPKLSSGQVTDAQLMVLDKIISEETMLFVMRTFSADPTDLQEEDDASAS